jgi:gamma-glutamyltranspeptidase/glutathione hydrolase
VLFVIDPREINLSELCWQPGPKKTAKGLKAAVSTDNAVVTYSMLNILRQGGTAFDAAIAGCLLQGTIEPFMTNHAGSVTFLCYQAKTGQYYQMDSTGTYPPHLPLHRPIPAQRSGYAAGAVHSCIPGFMKGLKAIHQRFGTLGWDELCKEAIYWAEHGNHVSQFELEATIAGGDILTYFPEGREFYYQGDYLPRVGERFPKPALAATLRKVAVEGPDYMITGDWAEEFVAKANELGWKITLDDMAANPPRWIEPLRFSVRDYELVVLGPPQQQGLQVALVLGILDQLGIDQYQPYSAEHLYFMAHALRVGNLLVGYVNDPVVSEMDARLFTDPTYHKYWAEIIKGHMPKVDLTKHMQLTAKTSVANHTGIHRLAFDDHQPEAKAGSCELSVVDAEGNWVQMMNTLQGGGIPGMVIGGVPMIGNHSSTNSFRAMDIKLVEGARQRLIMGHTMLLKDGKPVLQIGTPGSPPNTQAQALCNLIFFQMEPYQAISEPRMYALMDDNSLVIENRIAPDVVKELVALGINVRVNHIWDWHMGSFQCCYLDRKTGQLCTTVDPRRCGVADGLPASQ